MLSPHPSVALLVFFNDPATTEIYTLSLHDALPISCYAYLLEANAEVDQKLVMAHVYGHCDFFKNNFYFSHTNRRMIDEIDRKSTRLNSSHSQISYAVFCLKKKKKNK